MIQPVRPTLLHGLTSFCRVLRDHGFRITVAETADAARALTHIDIGDRREVYLALRTVLASRPEEYEVFDDLFRTCWDDVSRGYARARPDAWPAQPRVSVPVEQPRRPGVQSLREWLNNGRMPERDAPTLAVPLVSEREPSGREDFRTFGSEELERLRQTAARLARRLRAQHSRRWQPARRGRFLSFRRTLRDTLRNGGELVALRYRRRRRQRAKLVVLCDVSASMDLYARLLLQFLYALQNSFARVETFVFSTRLVRVTQPLSSGSYPSALARLASQPHGWDGGTRIGASIAEFNRNWQRLVDRHTIVLLLSDGWDTGEPDTLAAAMRLLGRRAAKLIWLNPLLGSPAYSPEAGGMAAALPFVDIFAPAHDLRSLEELGRHLVL